MIPIVMETRMIDVNKNWDGLLQMILCGILYVDYTNDEILERTETIRVLKNISSM